MVINFVEKLLIHFNRIKNFIKDILLENAVLIKTKIKKKFIVVKIANN